MCIVKAKLPSEYGLNVCKNVIVKTEKGIFRGEITHIDFPTLTITVQIETNEDITGYIEFIPILAAYIARVEGT